MMENLVEEHEIGQIRKVFARGLGFCTASLDSVKDERNREFVKGISKFMLGKFYKRLEK